MLVRVKRQHNLRELPTVAPGTWGSGAGEWSVVQSGRCTTHARIDILASLPGLAEPSNPGVEYAAGGVTLNQYEDLLIDALLDRGFSVEEAIRLIALQERVESERREEEAPPRFPQWISRTPTAGEHTTRPP